MRWYYRPAYQSAYGLTDEEMQNIDNEVDESPRYARPMYAMEEDFWLVTIIRPCGLPGVTLDEDESWEVLEATREMRLARYPTREWSDADDRIDYYLESVYLNHA